MTLPRTDNLLSTITPINLLEEEESFFASDTYNPQFKYSWEQEAALPFAKNKAVRLLKEAIYEQDHPLITSQAKALFQTEFENETRDLAQATVDAKPDYYVKQNVETIATAFRDALSYLDIAYEVQVVNARGFYFRPSHIHKKIFISKSASLQYFTVDGVVKHELTHVIRNTNANLTRIPHSLDYLPTEEGLACYMQDYYGDRGDASLFQHAAEYTATLVGLNGSLREIYDYFRDLGFDKKIAYQRSVRHKFGFKDTSKPGDIIKPSMYFYHEQKVKALEEERRWILFSAKESKEHLAELTEYSGAIALEKLKGFYNHTFT